MEWLHSLIIVAFCLLGCWSLQGAVANCVADPTPANCTQYKLPPAVIRTDLDSLCRNMPNMPGCTVDQICTQSQYQSSQYCYGFSILKDICDRDMPQMNGCNNYASMCVSSSLVLECDTPALPLPTSMQASMLITDMCSEMNMPDCDTCKGQGQYRSSLLMMIIPPPPLF